MTETTRIPTPEDQRPLVSRGGLRRLSTGLIAYGIVGLLVAGLGLGAVAWVNNRMQTVGDRVATSVDGIATTLEQVVIGVVLLLMVAWTSVPAFGALGVGIWLRRELGSKVLGADNPPVRRFGSMPASVNAVEIRLRVSAATRQRSSGTTRQDIRIVAPRSVKAKANGWPGGASSRGDHSGSAARSMPTRLIAAIARSTSASRIPWISTTALA